MARIKDKLAAWGKIFLPHSCVRYYPPQFIVRNPVVQGVGNAFDEGCEVAVIAYTVHNHQELAQQLGGEYPQYLSKMKNHFRYAVNKEIEERNIIVLHDYFSYSLTLFIRVEDGRQCISEIAGKMKKILCEAETKINGEMSPVAPVIDTGFIFIDKNHHSIQEAVLNGQQQALAISAKKGQSEFNQMVYEVNKIVAEKNIRLLAQPIIDVASKKIHAWEMLTRGPEGTSLESPLQLFSVARQTSSLYALEMIVLEKTLEQILLTQCREDIFINFTPITLGSPRFVADMKEMLSRKGAIPPGQITFEVTERDSIEEIENFVYNIKELRRMGFKIAVDDTGAGYASLNTISEIMPDIIKIDRSVIENIDKNSVKESMLKGLLLVAREAGSLVVAEGIENEEEASVLSRNKVDLAQGYFYARPGRLNSLASV
ncbi:EAL domain-containing protein [Mesobacillus zeae]|nr:EAL domain-containing protein [Mesobacillus zeae]